MEFITQALEARFEEVRVSELQRMRKKTASLTPVQRADLDAITFEVLRGIAARAATPLATDDGELAEVLIRLFGVAAEGIRPARDGAPEPIRMFQPLHATING